MKSAPFVKGDTIAMVVAHPGHELRVFGFLSRYKPIVSVLTDGSGSSGQSRLHRSQDLLREQFCPEGCWMGEFSDKNIYSMILTGEAEPLIRHTQKLADLLVEKQVKAVVGDALEGFNPSHDLCRFLIEAAVELAERGTGFRPVNLSFVLEASPGKCPAGHEVALEILLSPEEFAVKRSAARHYPELQHEMERALARFGEAPFASELMLEAKPIGPLDSLFPEPPYYETFGEKRKSEGVFQEIIRYHQHLRPLVEKIRQGLDLS